MAVENLGYKERDGNGGEAWSTAQSRTGWAQCVDRLLAPDWNPVAGSGRNRGECFRSSPDSFLGSVVACALCVSSILTPFYMGCGFS